MQKKEETHCPLLKKIKTHIIFLDKPNFTSNNYNNNNNENNTNKAAPLLPRQQSIQDLKNGNNSPVNNTLLQNQIKFPSTTQINQSNTDVPKKLPPPPPPRTDTPPTNTTTTVAASLPNKPDFSKFKNSKNIYFFFFDN